MSFSQPNQNNPLGGPGGSLFGSTNTTPGSAFGTSPAPASGPFGATSTSNSGGTGSLFAGAGSLFGGTGSSGSSTTAPATNAAPALGGGLFGATNASSSNSGTTTPKTGAFGSGGGLFGTTTSTTPASGGSSTWGQTNLFAKPVNAPIPPAQNLFSTPIASGSNTTATPASGGLFGSTTPKPPDNIAASTRPTLSGGLFGTKPAETAQSSTPAAGTPSGGLFGATTSKPAETTTGSTASSGSNLFGGGIFGKKPDAPAAPGATTANTSASLPFSLGGATLGSTPAPGGGLFGNLGSKDKADGKQDQAQTSSSNLFGGPKDASGEKKDGASASTLGTISNLFGAPKPSTEKKDPPAVTTSITKEVDKSKLVLGAPTNISAPPPSMLRGKTIEEIVNKWNSDLATQVREFEKFAAEVAVWDRTLIENGNNLAALCNEMLTAEREQSEIDQSLEHIEQQQSDLLAGLEMYEKTTGEILGGQGGSLRSLDTGPADTERDKNYMLATELYSHLDDLSGSLTQMIEAVNELSITSSSQKDGSSTGNDAINQISQILSSHLESLQWIDGAVRELESKISEVEKRVREAGLNGSTGLGASTNLARSRSFASSR